MICKNCQASIDDDLIFCVNCGIRLVGGLDTNRGMPAQPTVPFSIVQKKRNPLILIAVISLLCVGVVATFLGIIVWLKPFSGNETRKSASSAENNDADYPKSAGNSNADSNAFNKNQSSNEKAATDEEKTIVDETLTINKNEHKAFPYQITDNSTMLRGQAELLEGESFRGYVLLKEAYDTFLADPSYKVIGFSGKRGEIVKINEFTSADKYVLIIENKSSQPINLKIKLFLKKVE